MKLKIIIILFIGILAIEGVLLYKVFKSDSFGATGNYLYPSSGMLKPTVSSWGIGVQRASVSDDLTITTTLKVGSTASSSSLILDNGITFTTGAASASGACGTAGSFYLARDASMAICGTDNVWNPK